MMNIKAEIKILGDSYAGGFSCGLSMGDSGTMEKLRITEDNEAFTRYESESGIVLNVKHEKQDRVTAVNTSIENNSSEDIMLEMMSSFVLTDMVIDRIHRLQSCWSAEGKLRSESICDLHLEKSWNGCACRIEKFGNVGSMPVRKYFPMLITEDEANKIFTGIQLYTASSWQMEIRIKENDTYTISGGMADRDFGQWTKVIKPGESFDAPKAVVAQGSNILEVCDALVKAQKPHISPDDSSMDIMFNEYCTTWGNPTYDNVRKICDKIADKGIKFLVIDSGWYGISDNWWSRVGDWYVNEERFPGGMKKVTDYIRSKGMIPGLWFELESVTSLAENFKQTEHLIKKDGYPLTVSNRRFWDMEDPWVVDYLTKSVIGLLKDSGFGYVKIDYNDTMGIGCDGKDGMGENLRCKVEATKSFFRKISEQIPGIVIENCSSGGHRLEPSMLELVSQASFSDAHETTAIPLIAANMHRVIPPAQSQIWAVMRENDSDSRIFYSIVSTFLGRMCLSGDIYNLSEHQWELVEAGISFYKQISDIIRDGRTIAIEAETASYNKPEGNQLVCRRLENEGVIIYHRFENSAPIENIISEIRRIEGTSSDIVINATYGAAETDFSAQAWYYSRK